MAISDVLPSVPLRISVDWTESRPVDLSEDRGNGVEPGIGRLYFHIYCYDRWRNANAFIIIIIISNDLTTLILSVVHYLRMHVSATSLYLHLTKNPLLQRNQNGCYISYLRIIMSQLSASCNDKRNEIAYLQNEIQQLEGYLSELKSNSQQFKKSYLYPFFYILLLSENR